MTQAENIFMNYPDTPKTVAELRSAIEKIIPVGRSTCVRISVTGEEYIERVFRTHVLCGSEARLCKWAWEEFQAIAEFCRCGERIYWRIPPEIGNFDIDATEIPAIGARIYMRFLVSAKPDLGLMNISNI